MLAVSMLMSSLFVTPVADTNWWTTKGGTVTEHKEDSIQNCTLTMSNDEGRFAFVWNRNLPVSIMVMQNAWTFPPEQTMAVAMRIGNVWLENGNGEPNISAMTGNAALMVVPTQPLETLLQGADEIAIKVTDAQFAVRLPHSKMTALLQALSRCRATIGLSGETPRRP
jgi:hypothetical protein